MTSEPEPLNPFWRAIDAFVEHVAAQVQDRWSKWTQENQRRHVHEVVCGLLARQATLARELASNPSIWNPHSAPLFLRSMVENCITIAWILKSPDDRAEQFIAFGLGQEKLLLENAKADLGETGTDSDEGQMIEEWEHWLSGHRYPFVTEVNVGHWGPSLRDMAEEIGLIELHRNAYARWSSTTHNMWHHVVRFNLDAESCENPLHGYHRVPTTSRLEPDAALLFRAAEYFDITIRCFDEVTGTNLGDFSAVEVLDAEFQKLPRPLEPETTGDE